MADIYAFIRKMTGHDLVTPQDAKALTAAVDNLIDEITEKQKRINALAAELETVKRERDALTSRAYMVCLSCSRPLDEGTWRAINLPTLAVRCPCGTTGNWARGHSYWKARAETAEAQLAKREAGEAVKERRKFPILGSGGQKIDFELVADHGAQAQKNHYQSVERLAERGGLAWTELYAVLHNKRREKMDENEAMLACRALEQRYLSALTLPAPTHEDGCGEALHLTEYEVQVLLGTSIHGCNMSPDRVFSLDMAWHRLHTLGLIDRADGLAIITEKGRGVVSRMLSHTSGEVTEAARDVLAERERQKSGEGWTVEHDDTHSNGEMARAAGIYALIAGSGPTTYRNAREGYTLNDTFQDVMEHCWPWNKDWFKPTDRRRDLVKAGALILAEIERLDRVALRGDAS